MYLGVNVNRVRRFILSELSHEDFLLMGWLENPRFDYKKQFQRMKKVHGFTFSTRERLTPQRKTAIRKAFNKYSKLVSKIDSKKYTFIPAKKSQIKNLKSQFPVSNKGVIYNHPVGADVKRKTKIFGQGKKTKLVDEIIYDLVPKEKIGLKQYTFYLPWPEGLTASMRETWIDYITDTLKPTHMTVAINGYSGLGMKAPASMGQYAVDLMDKLGKKGKEILTGIYLIFFRRKGGKWINKTQEKINLLY